jgi:glycosyltransferase involved in cell wall biosynthesis
MKVSYIGAFNNLSGYADAARNNVCAISSVGIPIDAIPVSFENFSTDCGELGRKIKHLISSNSDAPVQIIHTIPPVFSKFTACNKYNIGYTAWESSELPHQWVSHINQLNEVWVPSQYNKDVFEQSGVTVPVFVIPHTFNIEIFEKEVARDSFTKPSGFVFYSIFQFLQRKGPIPLLKAYLTEFKSNEDVCLLLKTYLFDPTNPDEKVKIKEMIQDVKEKLRLPSYPNISLITSPLSRPQINAVHKGCNCLVSSHCSEGFGVTLAESMMAGNSVIATNYSGSTDFLSNETGYPVDYQLSPVFNMPWEAYSGNQVWADINIIDLKEKMRYVFNNKQEARVKGMRAKEFIKNNLSWEVVGSSIKKRLEDVYAAL